MMKSLRNVRRAVALLLTIIMLLGVVPFAAFADDAPSADQQIETQTSDTVEAPAESQEEPSEDETAREISEDEEEAPVEATDSEPEPAPAADESAEAPVEATEHDEQPAEEQPADDVGEPAEQGEPEPAEEPAEPVVDEAAEDVENPAEEPEAEPAEEIPESGSDEVIELPDETEEPLPESNEPMKAGGDAHVNGTGDQVTLQIGEYLATNTGDPVGQSWTINWMSLHKIKETGEVAYCLDPHLASHDGTGYSEISDTNEWIRENLTNNQRKAISLILGYSNRDYDTSDNYVQCAVQLLIWEIVLGERKATHPYDVVWSNPGYSVTDLYQHTIGNGPNIWSSANYNRAKAAYEGITASMATHRVVPSFAVDSGESDDKTPVYNMALTSNGKYRVTLPADTNGVLDRFNWQADGVTFTKSGNVMTVEAANRDVVNNTMFMSTPANVLAQGGCVYFAPKADSVYSADQPVVVARGQGDPVYAKFKLKADAAPKMATTATWQDGSKVAFDFEALSVKEKCNISAELPNGSYKMKTVLFNPANDKLVQAKISDSFSLTYGQPYVFETEFDVRDVKPLPAKMVVLEYLYAVNPDGSIDEDDPILVHDDKNDANQTVYTATISMHTMAHDNSDASLKFLVSGLLDDDVYITVDGNVEDIDCTLRGKLMERVTADDGTVSEKELLVKGKPVTAEVSITIAEGESVATVTFPKLSRKDVEGKVLVVYESLTRDKDDKELTKHEDIEDDDQTVYVPEGHTEAGVAVIESHYAYVQPSIDLTDIYYYSGLKKGETYELEAFVNVVSVDEDGNTHDEPLMIDGKPVVIKNEFVAEAESGHVEVTVTVPALVVDGTKYVFGEKLWYDGINIHTHYDVEDEDQTITLHELKFGTVATVNGEHTVLARGNVTIKDEISYEAIPDTTILFRATLAERVVGEDGKAALKPFLVNDKPITADLQFNVKEKTGSVVVELPAFSAEGLENRTLVIVEDAYEVKEDGSLSHLGTEDDPDNKDQSITFKPFTFGTVATVNGQHSVLAKGSVTVEDKINYTAVPGITLLFRATLYERVSLDGKVFLTPFLVNGKTVTADIQFVAENESGSVIVSLPAFTADGLKGRTLVIVEEAYMIMPDGTEVHIGTEDNPDNKDQSITFFDNPKTGDENNLPLWYALLAACSVGILFMVFLPIRRFVMDKVVGKNH